MLNIKSFARGAAALLLAGLVSGAFAQQKLVIRFSTAGRTVACGGSGAG